jgi:hypothetical protein
MIPVVELADSRQDQSRQQNNAAQKEAGAGPAAYLSARHRPRTRGDDKKQAKHGNECANDLKLLPAIGIGNRRRPGKVGRPGSEWATAARTEAGAWADLASALGTKHTCLL